MARRQVNNIARLTQEQRYRVCQLLVDGATYEDVRDEMALLGVELKIHNTSLIAYQQSNEFKKYTTKLLDFRMKIEDRNMTANIQHQGVTPTQNLIEVDLMETLRRILPSIEDAKTAKAISSTLKDLADLRKNSEIARLEQKISDLQASHAEDVAQYQAQIAELSAKIMDLTENRGTRGISKEALEQIEEKVGLL